MVAADRWGARVGGGDDDKDPNAYKYKWSNESKNFQEQLDHFISEQNSRFQVVFESFF